MEQPNIIYPPGHESAPKVPATDMPTTPTAPATSEPEAPKPKTGLKKTLIVILVLLLIGGAGFGAYFYQQQQINTLNAQITTLNDQATALNKQINTLSTQLKTTKTTTTPNQNVVKITNLGFQLTVPDSIKDLTFTTTSTTAAPLSTASLTTKDPACAANANVSGLGIFSKGSGTFDPKAAVASPPTLVKQFTGFYITYTSPQAACSTNSDAQALAIAQIATLKTTFPTATLIGN